MPGGICAGKEYDKNVPYYTTQSMNGGTTFKCSFCEHTVTTLNFNSVIGNRRTQAATAMNQHAAELHLPSHPPSHQDGRPGRTVNLSPGLGSRAGEATPRGIFRFAVLRFDVEPAIALSS